jgi:hypothetical protein
LSNGLDRNRLSGKQKTKGSSGKMTEAEGTPRHLRLAVLGADYSGKSFLLSKLAPSTTVDDQRGYVVSTAVVSATNADGQTFFVELLEIPTPATANQITNGGATADVLLRQGFDGAMVLVDGLSDRCYGEACKLIRLLGDYQKSLGNADLPILVLANLSRGAKEEYSAHLKRLNGETSSSLLDWLLDEGGGGVAADAPKDFKAALTSFLLHQPSPPSSSSSSSIALAGAGPVPLHLVRVQPGVAPSLAARFKRRGGGAAGKRLSMMTAGGDSLESGLIGFLRQCCRVRRTPSHAARARLGDDDDDVVTNAANDDDFWHEWYCEAEDENVENGGDDGGAADGGNRSDGATSSGSSESAAPHPATALAFGSPSTTSTTDSSSSINNKMPRRSSGGPGIAGVGGSAAAGGRRRKRRLKKFPVAFAPLYRDSVPFSAIDALVEAAIRHQDARRAAASTSTASDASADLK